MRKTVLIPTITIVLILIFLFALPAYATEFSGACGTNIKWAYDEPSHTLTFTGHGEMNAGTSPAWHDFRFQTEQIIIGEGITSISAAAFMDFTLAESVTFPSTLKKVGDSAFSGCLKLQFPSLENLTSIGRLAFYNCYKLNSVTIHPSITKISNNAFSGCSGLESLVLHDNITEISQSAFTGCSSLTSVTMPSKLKSIGVSAFANCSKLTEAVLNDHLAVLEYSAFYGCEKLQKIHIPDGITAIKDATFSDCTALSEVFIGAGVQQIHEAAFRGCNALKKFTLSNENNSFTTDGGGLYNKNKTELILVPPGAINYVVCSGTKTVRTGAAYQCQNLISVTFPEGLTEIGEYAFWQCRNLTNITLAEGLSIIRTGAFEYTAPTKLTFPTTIQLIEPLAFSTCRSLKEVHFLGNVPNKVNGFIGCDATVYYSCAITGPDPTRNANDGLDGRWISITYQEVIIPAQAATCQSIGRTEEILCGTCGKVIIPARETSLGLHNYENGTSIDADTHRLTCSICSNETVGAHSLAHKITKDATCKEEGAKQTYCDRCNYTKDEKIPVQADRHQYDNTCDETCNLCNFTRNVTHEFGKEWASDSNNHWHTCITCAAQGEIGAHTPGTDATQDSPQLCTICNYELAAALGQKDTPNDSDAPNANVIWWLIPLGCGIVGAAIFILIKAKKRTN